MFEEWMDNAKGGENFRAKRVWVELGIATLNCQLAEYILELNFFSSHFLSSTSSRAKDGCWKAFCWTLTANTRVSWKFCLYLLTSGAILGENFAPLLKRYEQSLRIIFFTGHPSQHHCSSPTTKTQLLLETTSRFRCWLQLVDGVKLSKCNLLNWPALH